MASINSSINRLDQLSQIRETTLEASATNAETGETYHGAEAVYRLQARHSASNRAKGQVNFDLDDPKEVEKFRVSVTRRAAASIQDSSIASTSAQVIQPPFPTKTVVTIIANQVLTSAPLITFAAMAPYIYASLVGDFQTAGTVSSIATGISMILQTLFTPIAAQIMDMYGRKKLAILAACKSVILVVPLLIAGMVINSGTVPDGADETDAKLGAYLSDNKKLFVQCLFGLYWLCALICNATATSQSIVAIGDVCPTQRTRSTAIAMYAGCSYTLAAFAIVGAKLSIMAAGFLALVVALLAVGFSVMFMPETIKLDRGARRSSTNSLMAVEEARATSISMEQIPSTPNQVVSSSSKRRTYYPLQREFSGVRRERVSTPIPTIAQPSGTASSEANEGGGPLPSTMSTAPQRITFDDRHRIVVFGNPFAGFSLLKKSRCSYIALWVLFSCLMAEISASDTLVYYLTIKLEFDPSDVSYLQIEQALMSVILCGVVGPLLSRRFSCSQISMGCSAAIVTALITLALASSKTLIYIIYSPCIAVASVQMPSLAAIITKNATKPEEVSLAMSTVMAVVAVLQAGGSFFAALVFKALPRDKLYFTFIFSALFTVPMFILSVYLGIVIKEEERSEAATNEKADQKVETI